MCARPLLLRTMSSASYPSEVIWFADPTGLFVGDRLAHFLPEKNTTLAVQLNALMRLAIYTSVIMILFQRYSLAVYIPVGTAALTYSLYITSADYSSTIRARAHARARTEHGVDDVLLEGMTREGGNCTVPTPSNPFMNILPTEYGTNTDRPAACDISSPAAHESAESLFNNNLYRDVDDVFHRTTSSHSFYTMPNTQIPNDQGGFAKWCYGTGPTFKEGGLSGWNAGAVNLQLALGDFGDSGDVSGSGRGSTGSRS